MHSTSLKLTSGVLIIVAAFYWYYFSMSQTQSLSLLYARGDVSFNDSRMSPDSGSLPADNLHITTGSNGIATLSLDDGTRIQVLPNSDLTIERARQDRRELRSEVELQLNAGEIIKRVPAHDERTRKSTLFTNAVNIGVRGTEFVAMAEPDISRLMVTEGEVVAGGGRGPQVDVPVDFGTVAKVDQEIMQPVPLLPPPTSMQPAKGERVLDKALSVSWQPENDATAWAFEVADDPEFVRLWWHEVKDSEGAQVDAFERDGTYYWRVASIDRHGLRGRWSEARSFTYKNYFEQGRLSLLDGDFDKALNAFSLAEEGYLDELGFLFDQANDYLAEGNFESSRRTFLMIDKLIPNSRNTQNGLARVDAEEGRYEEAWQRIDDLLDAKSDDTYTLETAAIAAVGQGDYIKAKAMAEKALMLDANSAIATVVIDSIN